MTVAGRAQGVAAMHGDQSGDALIGNYSQTDQTFAIVYGVAPPRRTRGSAATSLPQGMKEGPMDFGQLELALVEAGQPDALVTLLTNIAGDGPAKILAEGGTSMWEQWDPGCSAPSGQAGDNDTYNDGECSGSAISPERDRQLLARLGLGRRLPGDPRAARHHRRRASARRRHDRAARVRAGVGPRHRMDRARAGHRGLARATGGPAAGQDALRVSVPDNVRATVSLPAGSAAYRASGAGAPRYVGTKAGRVIYTVGSGVTTFTP